MLPLEEVRAHVVEKCPPRTPRLVPVGEALGLVTAADISATEAIPPFANTAMDGFAVRSADTAGAPVSLEIVETIPAGHAPERSVGAGQASRIMVGKTMRRKRDQPDMP